MKFEVIDERPVNVRAAKELTQDEQDVLEAFQASIKQGNHEVTAIGKAWLGKPIKISVAGTDEMKALKRMVQKAANSEDMGFRFRITDDEENGKLACVFWAVELGEALYVTCGDCERNVRLTKESTLTTHGPRDNRCKGSGKAVQVAK